MIAPMVHLPLARLKRNRRLWVAAGAWCALGIVMAAAARSRGAAHGADHVLVGAYGALVLPLLAYVLVGATLGARSMSAAAAPLVALGATPMRAAAAEVAVAAGGCALVGGALAAVIAVVAHGVADPPAVRDAMASAYAGGLGGVAYAAWFAAGAGFGRWGGGRTALLLVDWVLGATGGGCALLTPRVHVRNLLGGMPPMGLSERASAVGLAVIAVACTVVATRRART